jgi:hypothetical protein
MNMVLSGEVLVEYARVGGDDRCWPEPHDVRFLKTLITDRRRREENVRGQ